jgi:integrase/recombinase XerD
MLSELFDFPARIREIRGGPAGVHIEAFAEQLFQRGYSKISTRRHIRSAEHIVRWAVRQGLSPHDLGERALKGFGDHLSRCRCGRYHCANRVEVVPSTSDQYRPPFEIVNAGPRGLKICAFPRQLARA